MSYTNNKLEEEGYDILAMIREETAGLMKKKRRLESLSRKLLKKILDMDLANDKRAKLLEGLDNYDELEEIQDLLNQAESKYGWGDENG